MAELKKEAEQVVQPNFNFKPGDNFTDLSKIDTTIKKLTEDHPNAKKFNSLVVYRNNARGTENYYLLLFEGNEHTKLEARASFLHTTDAKLDCGEFGIKNKSEGSILLTFELYEGSKNIFNFYGHYREDESNISEYYAGMNYYPYIFYSTVCPVDVGTVGDLTGWKGWYPNHGIIKKMVELSKHYFKLADRICNGEIINPIDPPSGGQGGGQTDNSSCSNTGQFGGCGTPLKDIKLFLYANKVTKGTIKLSKPQVEVGTFATDWRPNPSDYVERHSPAYKEVKGIAIQHNQSQNKKYLEIETADGFAYGVDLWGGDTKKLLEQQQKEIEELKKLVQTLEAKINV